MNKFAMLTIGLATILAGCATKPPHRCALADSGERTCVSIEQAYKAANVASDAKLRPVSVFDPVVDAAAERRGQVSVIGASPANMPDATPNGLPVFKQPRVHRVYIPAHVDADGNMRSGEYTYFATEGEWNYGTLRKSGAASDMFEPARNTTPVGRSAQAAGTTPASPSLQPAAPPAIPPGARASVENQIRNASTVAPRPQTPATQTNQVDGITQPYQRLN